MKLNNGFDLPEIGFGVFKSAEGSETENAVLWALEAGYKNIDTAYIYKNEKSVGEALKKSKLKREEYTITTKLWNDDIRNRNTKEAFFRSLELLGLDYVDLYLIHWPAEGFMEAWPIIEELYNEGYIKSIGVSNFHKHHLEELSKIWTIKPMVNQIESHPYFNNQELIDYCQNEGILVQSWSPLGGSNHNLCNNEELEVVAKKYNKSIAQIIMRWNIQRSVMPLPKSVNKDRIFSNIDVYDFDLAKEDIEYINSLNKFQRAGADPDSFDF